MTKAPGAQRELLFVNLSGIRNVIPVMDSGETADEWVIVMPRADMSLQDRADAHVGPLDLKTSKAVLTDILGALVDMYGEVVHRDLKPANILLWGSTWHLADFGISRYAEASASNDTRKYALSAAYAAPERWRNQHATIAADIYSWGVIAYQLLTGSLPFPGPQNHEFRDQHIHAPVPKMLTVPSPLAAIIGECLYKPAAARPSPANLMARLEKIGQTKSSGGLAKLQGVNQIAVARKGELEALAAQEKSQAEVRKGHLQSAELSDGAISAAVCESMTDAATAAKILEGPNESWNLNLRTTTLRFDEIQAASNLRRFSAPFSVIAHGAIGIVLNPGQAFYKGRGHSLWYCDAKEKGRFGWFETAFMAPMSVQNTRMLRPAALAPDAEAAKAFVRAMGEVQVAWLFTELHVGDLEEFIERWAGWFAQGIEGTLTMLNPLPERDLTGSWRRG